MAVILVVSEQDGEGKTSLCAAVVRAAQESGRSSAVVKLAASGDSDPDAEDLASLLGQQRVHRVALDAGPLTSEVLKEAAARVAAVADGVDVVLVEGSCSLSDEESARLAEAIDARAVIVSGYRHDMTASHLTHWREAFGDRLAGVVVNGMTRYMGTDTTTRLLPSLEEEGLAVLGVVPEERRLLGSTVAQIAESLYGRFVACEEQMGDALVEHLMVGGMGMDPGQLYFSTREDKAVIVRGDRPDIQMSALETPTTCLVLTKGIEPIEYVKYEAELEGVAVVVVPTDTLGTMDALAPLMESSRFDHPAKLERFAGLVSENVDLSALLGAGVGE